MVQSVSLPFLLILLTQVATAVDKSPLYEWYKGLNMKDVVIAINCGAEEPMTDQGGIYYLAD